MNAPIKAPKRPRCPTAGNREQGSNWITKKRRRQIYARDAHTRMWCLKFLPFKLSLDHVVSRARGGSNRSDNLVTSCLKCNTDRGEKSLFTYALSKDGDPIQMILRVLGALEKPLPEVA